MQGKSISCMNAGFRLWASTNASVRNLQGACISPSRWWRMAFGRERGRERKAQCYCIKVPIHYGGLRAVIESGAVRVWVTPSAHAARNFSPCSILLIDSRRPFERRASKVQTFCVQMWANQRATGASTSHHSHKSLRLFY